MRIVLYLNCSDEEIRALRKNALDNVTHGCNINGTNLAPVYRQIEEEIQGNLISARAIEAANSFAKSA